MFVKQLLFFLCLKNNHRKTTIRGSFKWFTGKKNKLKKSQFLKFIKSSTIEQATVYLNSNLINHFSQVLVLTLKTLECKFFYAGQI